MQSNYQTLQTTKSYDSRNQTPLMIIFSWSILIISLIGGGSTGAFYYYIQPECQMLKSSWRMLAFALSVIPLAIFEYLRQKDTYIYSTANITNSQHWITMFWSSLAYSVWTVGFMVSLNHISVAQANLLTNLSPIVIVIYKYFGKQPVSRPEILGSVIAAIGAAVLAFDHDVKSKEEILDLNAVSSEDRLLFGIIVGLLGSVGGAFYLTKSQEMNDNYPLCLRILITSFMSFFLISFASMVLEGASVSLSPENGIFGLFNEKWIVIIVYTVIATGYGGYFAYILAVKYFDALLVSIILTLEPVAAALIVFALGWQSFPGILTILGCILIIGGIYAVLKGEEEQNQTPQIRVQTATPKAPVPMIPLNSE